MSRFIRCSVALLVATFALAPVARAADEGAPQIYLCPEQSEASFSANPGQCPICGKALSGRPVTPGLLAVLAGRLADLIEKSAKEGNWRTGRPQVWRMVSLAEFLEKTPAPANADKAEWAKAVKRFTQAVSALEEAGEAKNRDTTIAAIAPLREVRAKLSKLVEGQ